MRIFYVIKNPIDNKYLSVNGVWDNFLRCAEFDSEDSALGELGRLDGYFIIQKVYNL